MKKISFLILAIFINVLLINDLHACENGNCATSGCRCKAEGGMPSCTCKPSSETPSGGTNPEGGDTPPTPAKPSTTNAPTSSNDPTLGFCSGQI